MTITVDTHALAQLGAEVRLTQLRSEQDALERFLNGRGAQVSAPALRETADEASQPRRHMSAKARKAVSERMRAYWEGRRAAAAQAAMESAPEAAVPARKRARKTH
jgi:hypothetical protein